jgi:hypothetical protein
MEQPTRAMTPSPGEAAESNPSSTVTFWEEDDYNYYNSNCSCEGAFGYDSDGDIRHYGLYCSRRG